MFNHVKDHNSLPCTLKTAVFFLTMPISCNSGYFIYEHPAGVPGQGCAGLGTLSADVETLAREIPSAFIEDVTIQLMNHSADMFCGSNVLIIVLKTNAVSWRKREPAKLGELSTVWRVLNNTKRTYPAHM